MSACFLLQLHVRIPEWLSAKGIACEKGQRREMKWIAMLGIVVMSLAFSPPSWSQESQDEARDLVYLSDFLKAEPYRSAWDAMLEGVKVDAWITRYIEEYDGVESPSMPIQVDGETFRIADVCKPHECDTNFMYVLFSPDGQRAWGLVNGDRWLGHPDARIQSVIIDECNRAYEEAWGEEGERCRTRLQ